MIRDNEGGFGNNLWKSYFQRGDFDFALIRIRWKIDTTSFPNDRLYHRWSRIELESGDLLYAQRASVITFIPIDLISLHT